MVIATLAWKIVAVGISGSGLKFEGLRSLLKRAVQLCIKAHKLLYNNFIIGWDVVITDQSHDFETNEKAV